MLLRSVTVLFFLFLVTKNEGFKTLQLAPYASIAEARDLLDNLYQLILGNILSGHDQLDDLRFEITSQSINVELTAEVDIQQEHVTLEQEVANLKGLALTAEVDITSCLDVNEDLLEGLPETYLNQIKTCISTIQEDSDAVLAESRYKIDVFFNQIPALNFTLNRCSIWDTSCINQVVRQINTLADDIPVQIDVEVANASDSVDIVKVKIQNCYDEGIAGYVQEGSNIIQDITQCVDAMLP